MTDTRYAGSCLCGTVRYELGAEIRGVSHCHCSMCRKAHGAAFATYAGVPRGAHRFSDGAAAVREFRSSPAVLRSFCSGCGSPLLWRSTEMPEWVFVPLGTLDTPYVPPAQRHIHVQSRAAWHEITDAWPQNDAY